MSDPASPADISPALIAEQFSHAVDLLKADQRMAEQRIATLEKQAADYEERIRRLTESATQFKLLVSLAAGGGLLSVISLIRALFGGVP
jgi:hypothetical protein